MADTRALVKRAVLIAPLLGAIAFAPVGCSSGPSQSHEVVESAVSSAASTTALYVDDDLLAEHLAPKASSQVTNRLGRGTRVEVLEQQGEWSRVSRYYDGAVEGESGQVARWVRSSGLTSRKPHVVQAVPVDPRIAGLPNVGVSGITQRDVDILQTAGLYYLETGLATRISYGDKSLHRPGMYYLNFDRPTNHFFAPSDIPNIEDRIRRLRR